MLRRRKMHLTVGTSELDGFDVGKYPLHHFVPGPGCGGELRNRLPVYIRSAGRDEWVKGCFRHRRNSDIFAVEFVVSGEFAFTRHGRRHLIGPGGVFLGHPDGGESCMEVTSDYAEKRTVIIRGAALEGVTGALNLDEVDLLRPAAPEDRLRPAQPSRKNGHPQGPVFFQQSVVRLLGPEGDEKRLKCPPVQVAQKVEGLLDGPRLFAVGNHISQLDFSHGQTSHWGNKPRTSASSSRLNRPLFRGISPAAAPARVSYRASTSPRRSTSSTGRISPIRRETSRANST